MLTARMGTGGTEQSVTGKKQGAGGQKTGTGPNWDMSPYFPSASSPELVAFMDALRDDIAALSGALDAAPPIDETTLEVWAQHLKLLEVLFARVMHLESYLGCTVAADAGDETAAAQYAKVGELEAAYEKLEVMVRAAFGDTRSSDFDALLSSRPLMHAGHYLRRLRTQASLEMLPDLEKLQADLSVNGLAAWGRLYGKVTAGMRFTLRLPDKPPETYPVAMVRTLSEDPDPDVRRATFEGASEAFEAHAPVIASCLNAISGTRCTLYDRRGIADPLTPALFAAGIERGTLDAMMSAIRARQPVIRRYLVAKAKFMGLERLGFHELRAPLPLSGAKGPARVSLEDGKALILRAFGEVYPELSSLASEAFEERWIDHSPREGKRPGAFCSSSPLAGQSRIFMTYNGALGDIFTLAHELGHAFHNRVIRGLGPFARVYPMTLAESASTFAEAVLADHLRRETGTDFDDLAVLDQRLQKTATFILDIPTRFDFEVELYARRPQGELSVSALCEMMLDAQRSNFGESLGELDPWFWASKLHFYLTYISFYNFPYAFGFLFSTGLFSRTLTEGADFLATYEDLLRRTGSESPEAIAKKLLNVRLSEPSFWESALDWVTSEVDAFEALVEARG